MSIEKIVHTDISNTFSIAGAVCIVAGIAGMSVGSQVGSRPVYYVGAALILPSAISLVYGVYQGIKNNRRSL